jgi:CRP-like cAMP-binding protein
VKHFRPTWGLKKSLPIQTFAECPIFQRLTLEQIKEISSRAAPVRYLENDFIFEIGDPAIYWYLVHEGLVRMQNIAPSGKTFTFDISGPGRTLNASALSIGTHFLSAQALTDVTLLRIERNEFLGFVSKYPNLATEIIHILSVRLKTEYRRMVVAQREEVERQVCSSLLALSERFGMTLHLKREELADCVGTTTETTTRVLSRLKKSGIVSYSRHRGEIVIADPHRLRIVAGEEQGQS